MRTPLIVCFLLVCLVPLPALCQQQLDAATREDVMQLMEMTGARDRIQQLWDGMIQQTATTAADSYRLKHPEATPLQLHKVAETTGVAMRDALKVFSIDELIEAIIPVYQRHLTHADVRSIIDFYNSPPGQKLVKEMPALMSESIQAVDPIIKGRLPEMQAAAEKAVESSMKDSASDKENAP